MPRHFDFDLNVLAVPRRDVKTQRVVRGDVEDVRTGRHKSLLVLDVVKQHFHVVVGLGGETVLINSNFRGEKEPERKSGEERNRGCVLVRH